jgi:hypothetical protein
MPLQTYGLDKYACSVCHKVYCASTKAEGFAAAEKCEKSHPPTKEKIFKWHCPNCRNEIESNDSDAMKGRVCGYCFATGEKKYYLELVKK